LKSSGLKGLGLKLGVEKSRVEMSLNHFAATVASENFIFRHDSYVDPINFVLNNDNVVLMGVSPTQVIIEAQGFLYGGRGTRYPLIKLHISP
jgi:hypothetical protein